VLALFGGLGRLRLCVLLHHAPAVSADADYPQQMLRDLKPVLGGHRVLDGFEFGGEELDYLAALGTDHVIVVLVFVVVLVVRAPVTEPNLACESSFSQEFERAVDGSLPDSGILFLHEAIEIFVREMFLGA